MWIFVSYFLLHQIHFFQGFLLSKKTKFFSQIQVFFTMIYSCWSWWLLSRLAMYGIQILNLTFLNLIFRFRFWFTFLKTKSKKSNRNILLRNKIINKFIIYIKICFWFNIVFLFYFKNTQTKLKSRMMNLELKDFSLYDFLNLSLIKIYEPFFTFNFKKIWISICLKSSWSLEGFQFPVWNFYLNKFNLKSFSWI